MTDHLNRPTVLVLNRAWQAINTRSPQEAFCQLATGVATALDIDGDSMVPVKWADWIKLPIREQDDFVSTAKGRIRVPTVIVLANYSHVPTHRPKFSYDGIWERDKGTCQYTGRKLKRGEGNIDHVVPRARGGKTNWRNCVLSDRNVNSAKADKSAREAGLKLLRKPQEPPSIPAVAAIRNTFAIPEWDHFLIQKAG